jgi:hypothetical protein
MKYKLICKGFFEICLTDLHVTIMTYELLLYSFIYIKESSLANELYPIHIWSQNHEALAIFN